MSDSTTAPTEQLPAPLQDLAVLEAEEHALTLPHFTAADAWTLGTLLRARLLRCFPHLGAPSPSGGVVIHIAHANGPQPLFHAALGAGTGPDNDDWVRRKRATALRWGRSSWYVGRKAGGDEARFREKYALLGGDRPAAFAIHGGAWPVRVRGVDGVVGVVVVSGLKQEQDHQVIVETLKEFLAAC